MQLELFRRNNQILSISLQQECVNIRKLYFPKGRFRKETLKVYNIGHVRYNEDLRVVPTVGGAICLIRGVSMEQLADVYNVYWDVTKDDWEPTDKKYHNTYYRKSITGVFLEKEEKMFTTSDGEEKITNKLLMLDEEEQKIASIPWLDWLYSKLNENDYIRISAIEKGVKLEREENGEWVCLSEKPVNTDYEMPQYSNKYAELLEHAKTIANNKGTVKERIIDDGDEQETKTNISSLSNPWAGFTTKERLKVKLENKIDSISCAISELEEELEMYQEELKFVEDVEENPENL